MVSPPLVILQPPWQPALEPQDCPFVVTKYSSRIFLGSGSTALFSVRAFTHTLRSRTYQSGGIILDDDGTTR